MPKHLPSITLPVDPDQVINLSDHDKLPIDVAATNDSFLTVYVVSDAREDVLIFANVREMSLT